MKVSGAPLQTLAAHSVRRGFAIPGGAINAATDAIRRHGEITFIATLAHHHVDLKALFADIAVCSKIIATPNQAPEIRLRA